jgi:hypothetical protein
MKRVAVCVTLTLLVACGGQKPGRGTIHAVVSTGLVSTSGITRVTVTVTPAGVTQDLTYNVSDGTFAGTLTVATGAQTVTAIAYTGSAPNETEAGRGSASVTIVTGANASVDITIYDTTGPPPPPDHGPVILTFVVANTTPMSGTEQTLAATAMDADGQAIAYAWTQAPANCGAFSDPSAASTQWTAGPVGPCAVTITATANGKSDARSKTIQIVQATGFLDVTGHYVPQPFITHVAVLDGGIVWWDVARGDANATSPNSLATGASYEVRAYYAPASGAVVALTDSCGGVPSGPAYGTDGSGSYAAFNWTAPASPDACILTPQLTVPGPIGGFHDVFPIVVRVGL